MSFWRQKQFNTEVTLHNFILEITTSSLLCTPDKKKNPKKPLPHYFPRPRP